jgi:uncharacterized protein YlzI (FlbEa/FlbD family)
MMEGRGPYKAIKLSNAVSSAKEMLGIEDTSLHDVFLLKLADEAVRRISSQKMLVKSTKCFAIENNMVRLPDGFSRLLAVAVDNNRLDNRALYVENDFIEGLECTTDTTLQIKPIRNNIEIVGDYIVFSSDIEANNATISYRGYNLDEDCMMVMYDHQENAVLAYICWKFTMRHFLQYPRDIREAYKTEYVVQKSYIRGFEFTNQFEQQKAQIGAIYNALLLDMNQEI